MIHHVAGPSHVHCTSLRAIALFAVLFAVLFGSLPSTHAAIGTAGDVSPVPPTAGGNVAGPFRIGNTTSGAMTIADGILLTNTNAAILGDTITGIGVVVVDNSTWNLTTAGADLTVANSGAGSLRLIDFATMSLPDALFVAAQLNSLGDVSVTGFGTVLRTAGPANIAQRGQAVVTIQTGGRLLTGAGIVGDEIFSVGRVTLRDQFSLWRSSSALTIANAGRGMLQVLDGARVESASATIGNLAGSTGAVEVAGISSVWESPQGIVVGETGHGTLRVSDGGYVTTGVGASVTSLGRQVGSTGQVEVRGRASLLSTSSFTVGGSGDGVLRILEGGRARAGNAIMGDSATARSAVIVDGPGSEWDVAALTVSDPGEAQLRISGGGLVRSSAQARVNALGRLTLDGGRLEIDNALGLTNVGIVEGNGAIDGLFNNNASGQLRPHGESSFIITGALINAGLVDVPSGELEVFGPTTNNLDIDAREGATLRFRGSGLDNNTGSQLAITSGVVDVFGLVDNNVGAEIAVGGTAVAVFHDAVTNAGTVLIQPGGKLLTLENLAFASSSVLNLPLNAEGAGKLEAAGDVQLAGDLNIDLAGGFVPLPGDQFNVLSSGGLGGTTFSAVSAGPANGLQFFTIYSPTDVTIFTAAAGEKTWALDANGQTSISSNWLGGEAPGGVGDVAAFTTIITADRTVTADQPLTLGRLKFDDDNNYRLAGPQTLTMQAPAATAAVIESLSLHGNGAHTIAAPIVLASNLDLVQHSAGALSIAGALDNSAGRTITKLGPGPLVLSGAQMHGAGAILTVAEGTMNVNNNAGSNAARNLTVNANSTTNFGAGQHLAALNIGTGATATLTSGGSKNLVTGALTIAGGSTPTGRLNLTSNAAVIEYPSGAQSPIATVRSQIIAGRGASGFGATWTGDGITSSAAAAAVLIEPESRSVGYAENATMPLGPFTTFRGQPVDDTSILMLFTRTGDANLDGVVDDDDVTIVGATYAPGVPQPHWALGDFDYNGFVDDDDVTLLGAFYNPSAMPLAAPAAAAVERVAAVPEPPSVVLVLLGAALCVLAAKRRVTRRSTSANPAVL
jgi:T5SS/PEP-CTERM-associated repeat protein